MPNSFHEHYWILDSASATAVTADDVEGVIRWVAPVAAAGNQVVIQDNDGNTVWESVATGVNYVEESRAFRSRGLVLSTLDTGTLYYYHKLV